METKVISPKGKEVKIGDSYPTVIIGERINPFGKSGIKEALERKDIEPILKIAEEQISEGADILNVNVAAFGVDEAELLPFVVENLAKRFDVPLCLESRNKEALRRTLDIGLGKPIINSVSGEFHVMESLFPLAKEYNAVFVIIASDGKGIPKEPERRISIVGNILEEASKYGIKKEDIIVDSIVESIALSTKAAENTFKTMRAIKSQWDLNLILGASNISFGLPMRNFINVVFLSAAVLNGLTCVITNAKILKPYIMAADLIAGKDNLARRYTSYMKSLKTK
ncbi:MAG: dihydropteroate synthase [Deltaproteobacteria bacterium]|nr:dihydropteroate synthase [Deltaproteobacteria bacterium]